MKKGVSPKLQIMWQKKVISNQLTTIEARDQEIKYWITERNALQKKVIELQDHLISFADYCQENEDFIESYPEALKKFNDTR